LSPWGRRNGYALYRCCDCGHRFADLKDYSVLHQNPDVFRQRFTHHLMETDDMYYRHLCLGEKVGRPTYATTELILAKIQAAGYLLPAGRWLDVGSGSGYLVQVLQRRGWDVVGIEPGGWGQIAARDKGIPVVQGFLGETTFSGKFDFISATDVLEHQPDPLHLLRLIAHYLSRSGIAFISVPFAESFHGKIFKSRWAMVEPPTHCHFFTRASFLSLLGNYGLELAEMLQYNLSYPPFVGKVKAGRMFIDWFLSTTLGGDQALFIVRLRPDKYQTAHSGNNN
jgi:2-polyprenyl-3-methyl-5-hydroxy-6-metoxy-1,4-benzoquinol methylase